MGHARDKFEFQNLTRTDQSCQSHQLLSANFCIHIVDVVIVSSMKYYLQNTYETFSLRGCKLHDRNVFPGQGSKSRVSQER
jgi:hypothetical protein